MKAKEDGKAGRDVHSLRPFALARRAGAARPGSPLPPPSVRRWRPEPAGGLSRPGASSACVGEAGPRARPGKTTARNFGSVGGSSENRQTLKFGSGLQPPGRLWGVAGASPLGQVQVRMCARSRPGTY